MTPNQTYALKGLILLWMVLGLVSGCGSIQDPETGDSSETETHDPILSPTRSFLALGDSYTVGQGVSQEASWPFQLADSLAARGDTLGWLEILAQTGWTSEDLLAAVQNRAAAVTSVPDTFGLVTVMIGANNLFRRLDPQLFSAQMDSLIPLAVDLAGGRPEAVLGFSIPDYSVTPVGGAYEPGGIDDRLDNFNRILSERYAAAGIFMLDVTDLSRMAAGDPGLIARDNLHFSPEMYRNWVAMMVPEVLERFY